MALLALWVCQSHHLLPVPRREPQCRAHCDLNRAPSELDRLNRDLWQQLHIQNEPFIILPRMRKARESFLASRLICKLFQIRKNIQFREQ